MGESRALTTVGKPLNLYVSFSFLFLCFSFSSLFSFLFWVFPFPFLLARHMQRRNGNLFYISPPSPSKEGGSSTQRRWGLVEGLMDEWMDFLLLSYVQKDRTASMGEKKSKKRRERANERTDGRTNDKKEAKRKHPLRNVNERTVPR